MTLFQTKLVSLVAAILLGRSVFGQRRKRRPTEQLRRASPEMLMVISVVVIKFNKQNLPYDPKSKQ
jgi:hypothetical protein